MPTTAKFMSACHVRVTVQSVAVCVHHVTKWMIASRLRLNATKTQVIWLDVYGSGKQLTHVDTNISLLSTIVPVVESARYLGVIVDSRLTLSAHVAALCRVLPTPVTTPVRPIDDDRSCKNPSCDIYILSVGLLFIRCSTVCRTLYCTSCSLRRTPLHD